MAITINGKATINRREAEITALMSELRQIAIGESLPYEKASHIIGVNVQTHKGYQITAQARHRLVEEGYAYDVDSKRGFVRLNDEQVLNVTRTAIKKINTASIKVYSKLSHCCNMSALPLHRRNEYNLITALAGTVSNFTSQSKIRETESKIALLGITNKMPTHTEIVKMFS